MCAPCLSCMELEKAELDAVVSQKRWQRLVEGRFVSECYVLAIGKEHLANMQGHFQAKGIERHVLKHWQEAKACFNL